MSSESSVECTRCKRQLKADEVRMAQPLITFKELVRAAIKTPSLLNAKLEDVPYCPECRGIIAKQRQTEQLKFLAVVVAVLLILIVLVVVVL
ncbi:MAG TPA: hypothetical protein DEF47_19355 [Herpetosiphon sp.]|uniref:Uncharacterized protein n=1 Tax=Herpetosiphon aurantiacus (strain ATCC 23779 / DSM 785 / 114-95) TaxID=316274 RepID=A9B0K5_HERA2|nr:hypothetical protein [Herpetosiphon sp.]ABX07223.1 hypothetical protein Haur_4592 [Herpetosiphon aurantiacus DSM 785]HBW52049.1 hypothetical protein [Herpetosiphon sp.]